MSNEVNTAEIKLSKRKCALFSTKTIPWVAGFSIILLKLELLHVIFILIILSIISFVVNYKLCRIVRNK